MLNKFIKKEENLSQNPPLGFHVLAKPTGPKCNLACKYCFYLDKELFYPNSNFHMSNAVLENYIRQLIESHRVSRVTVAWQGGEPTLMGIDFFKRAISFQEKYRRPGMTFENTIQTNGTLLNDKWCEFFKENNFLVGISIDGPEWLHDSFRVDLNDKPTFKKVMRGLRLLQKYNVEYNVLVTVNRKNANYPLEVYRFLRDEARTSWIQFIPVVTRINNDGRSLYQNGFNVSKYSVRPIQFGRFLILIFDEWIRNDVGQVFVQTFEATARNWLCLPSSGMCVFEKTCGLGLALEHNGDLYSCDHYVEPDYLLGNILKTHMKDLVASEAQYNFGQAKFATLPNFCRKCNMLFACNGECPKNRFLSTPQGEYGLNYLCKGWKAFFKRVRNPMQNLVSIMRSGRPASDIMQILAKKEIDWQITLAKAKPRDYCLCGSGLKYNQCHGWKHPKCQLKNK